MATIEKYSAEITTAVTFSGDGETWEDVTGLAIASGNFTTGDKYLIICCQPAIGLNSATSSGHHATQVVHGSTAFADSYARYEQHDSQNDRRCYLWFDVWTAVSGEGIKVQFLKSSSSHTVETDNAVLVAINLSDDVTENTDWFYDTDSTSTQLTTTWSASNNASVTFTPSGSSTWAVFAMCRNDVETLTINTESRINSSGDVTDTQPLASEEGEDTAEQIVWTLVRAYSLTNQSNTFTQQSRITNTGVAADTRFYSKVLALNLDKFAAKLGYWSETEVLIDSATAFNVEVASQSIQPTVASDVLVITQHIYDTANSSGLYGVTSRQQIDNADDPTTQTADAYIKQPRNDVTDELPIWGMTMASSLDTSSHNIDIDVGHENDTDNYVEDISVVAFTMELAAGAGVPAGLVRIIGT